jgi:nucleoid-associated protein YgaU
MPSQNPPTDPLAEDPFQAPVRRSEPQSAPLPQDPPARTESATSGGFTRVEGQPRPIPGAPTRVAQVSSDFDPFGSSGSSPTRTQAERPVPPASDFAPTESFSAEGLGQVDIYEVQGGDNYWTISRKAYGTSKYFMALAKANAGRIPDPQRMRPGMKVMLPAREVLETKFRDQLPLGTGAGAGTAGEVLAADADPPGFFTGSDGRPRYRIGRKDTLTEIAHEHLGRTSRWIQIFEMNRDRLRDPHDLKLGTILVLPADASRVRLVQQASETR